MATNAICNGIIIPNTRMNHLTERFLAARDKHRIRRFLKTGVEPQLDGVAYNEGQRNITLTDAKRRYEERTTLETAVPMSGSSHIAKFFTAVGFGLVGSVEGTIAFVNNFMLRDSDNAGMSMIHAINLTNSLTIGTGAIVAGTLIVVYGFKPVRDSIIRHKIRKEEAYDAYVRLRSPETCYP